MQRPFSFAGYLIYVKPISVDMQAVQSDNKNPKIYAMIIPIKNEGADMPTILAKTDDVSIHEPFLTAASTPNGMPNYYGN
jgi:hypothetical protein